MIKELHSVPSFPGYVSVDALAHPSFGAEIFFASSEDFKSALENLEDINPSQYKSSPDHINFLRNAGQFPFLPGSMEKTMILSPQLSTRDNLNDTTFSSTATTVCLDPLDSTHPSW
jgi:hypothetical protein